VMVLGIDKDRHRISLGIKQTVDNPWERLAEQYATGTQVEGKVSRIHKSGVVVDLPDDVEGFVPMSHLALPEISKIEARFAPGDTLPLEVIEVSPENRRIVLSVKAHMEKQPEDVLAAYVAAHEIRPELLESVGEGAGDAESGESGEDEYGDREEDRGAPAADVGGAAVARAAAEEAPGGAQEEREPAGEAAPQEKTPEEAGAEPGVAAAPEPSEELGESGTEDA
jgi:small subunit ribosomal protein S1